MSKKEKARAKALEELKQVLLDERKKIVEHLFKLKDSALSELADVSGDSVDIAALEISQASMSKLGGREQKLLTKLDHALEKFEDDTYGICELTGEEIPIARLKARPVAQYTVEAKEMLERKEKGFRSGEDDDEWEGSPID